MKKVLIVIVVIIILLLISGYTEVSYCHYWTTTPPPGSSADYIKTTGLCRLNSYSGLPGGLLFTLITGGFGGMVR